MSQVDGTTPKYEAGFREAVRRLIADRPGGWPSAYTDEAALHQELRRAYHEGRMDGVSQVIGPVAAPGAVEDPVPVAEPLDIGLFEVAPGFTPLRISVVLAERPDLPTIGDDTYVWAVRQTRTTLGLSLVEADEFVRGVIG